ncbi:MAG: sugar transferase [Dehalococcoidia bacterium]
MTKRAFDAGVTLAVAPFSLIVTLAMAIALAVELRGWPFFVQARVGLNETPFRMYKLRTMRHAKPGEEPARVVDDWEHYVFSPPGGVHPRITRLGGFARRTSLDELPNLLNVFLGQMSLVGPRPEIPEIVEQYPDAYRRRHSVRPGIAGLAQVRGRSDLPYDEIMKYDLAYVDDHSFLGDLRLLCETAQVVIRREGAR